jgi:hypothetical protein
MSVFGWIKGGFFGILTMFILILWSFGGFIGAIIQASRDDMMGVVLSIFIPGYGAVVTVLSLFGVTI